MISSVFKRDGELFVLHDCEAETPLAALPDGVTLGEVDGALDALGEVVVT